MTGEFKFETSHSKTYATIENARKAVIKSGFQDERHFYMTNDEGRFFPVFTGGERAAQKGIHFHWHII